MISVCHSPTRLAHQQKCPTASAHRSPGQKKTPGSLWYRASRGRVVFIPTQSERVVISSERVACGLFCAKYHLKKCPSSALSAESSYDYSTLYDIRSRCKIRPRNGKTKVPSTKFHAFSRDIPTFFRHFRAVFFTFFRPFSPPISHFSFLLARLTNIIPHFPLVEKRFLIISSARGITVVDCSFN